MAEEEKRIMAKCTCGSILVWSHIDEWDMDAWVHWRPLPSAIQEGIEHEKMEGSDFILTEEEFEEWNDKTPEELAEYFTSMTDFWKRIKDD